MFSKTEENGRLSNRRRDEREWRLISNTACHFSLCLDLDVLDRAFASGVFRHEPGGLSTRELLRIIQNLHTLIVGTDIVECNPKRDPLGITATVAAKFFKEIDACMIESI
jgi:arginase family enzyme